jgi:hypothetical protein
MVLSVALYSLVCSGHQYGSRHRLVSYAYRSIVSGDLLYFRPLQTGGHTTPAVQDLLYSHYQTRLFVSVEMLRRSAAHGR